MIEINSEWGRIGPIWWINSNTVGWRGGLTGRRFVYWGEFTITGKFPLRLHWLKD